MSRTIEDVLLMLQRGFLPYRGHVQPEVYQRLDCPNAKRASWFEKQLNYVCIGCRKYCSLVSPEGFELVLPVPVKRRAKSCFVHLPQVSAKQLLESKLLLRVDEVAFILNVSESEVRNYVDEGRLEALPETPLRVTAESIKNLLDYANHSKKAIRCA